MPRQPESDRWSLLLGCLALLYTTAARVPAQTAWRQPGNLAGRANHAMAYDPGRDRVFMFGGTLGESCAIVDETWSFDGTAWAQVSGLTVAPPPRVLHGMVHDSRHQRSVVFGGYDANGAHRNDTWQFDGNSWTLGNGNGAPGAPPPRAEFGMAFDSVRGVTVLFGGAIYVQPGVLDDTWEHDGTVWAQRFPGTRPGARGSHAMAYDPQRQRTVLFGGENGSYLGDTWEWDGATWTELQPATSPSPREKHTMVYDGVRGRVVVFGGRNRTGVLNDSWELAPTGWVQIQPTTTPPRARIGHALAFDSTRGRVLLLGGVTRTAVTAETWELQTATWTQLNGLGSGAPGPLGRSQFGLAYDSLRQRTVLFGGNSLGGLLDETWEWDGTTWLLRTPTTRPPARFEFAMAYDRTRHVTVLHGGSILPNNQLDDTWEWDGTNWALRAVDGPGARCQHAMAFDPVRGRVILSHGHLSGGSYAADTFQWTGTAWLVLDGGTPPAARSSLAMATDEHRQRVVLFGGKTSPAGPFLSDLWEWDGTSWIPTAPPVSPVGRDLHGMAYDPIRRVTVLFGGRQHQQAGGFLSDLWEWDGTNWSARSLPLAPCPRAGMAMAFDEARGNLVLQGGMTQAIPRLWDTWLYSSQFPTGFVSTGGGCSGSAGVPALANDRFPFPGRSFAVTLAQARATTPAFFLLGLAPIAPIDLTPIGAPGCLLRAFPDLLLASLTNASGTTSTTLPLPADPSLIGGVLFTQYAVFDPLANPAQLAFSNDGRATIGSF